MIWRGVPGLGVYNLTVPLRLANTLKTASMQSEEAHWIYVIKTGYMILGLAVKNAE